MSDTARTAWRDRLAVVAGVGAVAAAAWLVPASVHIVGWTADGPTRIALFAPLARLVWIATAALGLAGGLVAWTWSSPRRLARVAGVVGPLSLMWLWAVPYLPWIPDRLTLLLVLAGPARWVIAAVALAAALRLPAWVDAALGDERGSGGRRTIFAVSLALYLLFAVQAARTFGPGGDEPHYLMIAQSLLADGDLLIENNHRNKEYRSFYFGDLRPDYMATGRGGKIYSIHAPGLPIVLLPAYAVAGYPGALVTMCLIAALTALAIFDLARAVAGRRAAILTWVATTLTVPFLPNAWLIYPEIAAALLVGWSAMWIWRPPPDRVLVWFWRGVALAALPWLHTKFVVFMGIFAAALAPRIWRSPRAIAAFAAPMVASMVLWAWYFYALYGVVNPEAPYGGYAELHVLVSNIPRGLLGLLFDQKFGLLFYSPIYLAAIAGCWVMLRRHDERMLGLVLLVVTAVFVGSTTRLYMWWGGSSGAARFLVPIVPCLAPMIALAFRDVRGAWARPVFGAWLAISVGVGVIGALAPEQRLLFSDPHGYARVLELLQAGAPLAASFPTFTTEDWRTPFVALLPWLAAGLLAMGAVIVVSRIATRWSAIWLGTVAGTVFLVLAAVVNARPTASIRDDTVRLGALNLIWNWDPDGHYAFAYGRNARVDESHLRELSVVPLASPTDRIALPAGAYEARVWFTGAGAREGEILITSQQKAIFGRYAGTMQNPTTAPFDLPSAVADLSVNVYDRTLANRVARTEIVPRAVVPVGARDSRSVRGVESIPGSSRGYIVYVDTAVWPEGGVFWTRGTDRATVLVAPGGASHMTLTLRLGPIGGDVDLAVGGQETKVRVDANGSAQFEFNVSPATRLVPVVIQSPSQFRPTDVDPQSDDARRLGCRVEIVLR